MTRTTTTVLLLAAACLAACRPTGDFGRARPSTINDDILPLAGKLAATLREEPVSWFRMTDDEEILRDRAWAFVRPPHVGDWWLGTLVEGQRTRILPELDPRFDRTRYYAYLRSDPYRSSEGRWNRVISDMQGDAMLVPPFCAVAARVRRTDVERLVTLERQAPDPAFERDAYARVAENNAVMSWVWRALGFRVDSYRFALDRLAVETPSGLRPEAERVFAALAATRCGDAPPVRRVAIDPGRRSRIAGGPDPFDAPVLQK